MKRRDFIKSTAIGCCGAIVTGSLIENALGNNSFDRNINDEALKNFLSLTDQDFKKLADTAIETSKRTALHMLISGYVKTGIKESVREKTRYRVYPTVKTLDSESEF